MSDGIKAMWDDAEHYEWLAKHFKEPVRTIGGQWPYYMDNKHYYELLERHRQTQKPE